MSATLRELVADREVLVCTGAGGVGKTTTAAALALVLPLTATVAGAPARAGTSAAPVDVRADRASRSRLARTASSRAAASGPSTRSASHGGMKVQRIWGSREVMGQVYPVGPTAGRAVGKSRSRPPPH